MLQQRDQIQQLKQLFRNWSGLSANQIQTLPASGSSRKYYRLSNGNISAIGTYNPSIRENHSFIRMAHHFHQLGLPVPEVYTQSKNKYLYLQTDLGDVRLFDLLETTQKHYKELTPQTVKLYQKSITALLRLQFEGGKNFDFEQLSYPIASFNDQAALLDLHYFKYYFLKIFQIPFDEWAIEKDFVTLAHMLTQNPPPYFQHRDYQSRNIMLLNEQPHIIDFQGGRKGETTYDLAALLWQAKAQIPMHQRQQLFNYYAENLKSYVFIPIDLVYERYLGMALLRCLQVLGTYGLRGKIEGKPHFYQSIPPALNNLKYLLTHWPHWRKLPTLHNCLLRAIEQINNQQQLETNSSSDKKTLPNKMHVHISSFSYKGGLPKDENGHGGGFIFDCRFLDNPGKLEIYKNQSGLDPNVQQFLLSKTETQRFTQRVFQLIDEAIDKYLSRNFDALQVHFGCTGGQHRSVFMAEQLAKHLQNRGFQVTCIHREKKHWPNR